MRSSLGAGALIAFICFAPAAAGQAPAAPSAPVATRHGGVAHARPGATPAGPRLYHGLGSYSRRVTTTAAAQTWFDQGLRLVYAFNHYEAERSFRRAAGLDPNCAMCYWGIAIAEGSNYNSPTDADREKRALAAIRQAQRLAGGVTPAERALIQAQARRHSDAPGAERAALDSAYVKAMREVVRQFPGDDDAATFFADAMMNLRPWNLWAADGSPQPGTQELVQALERVLARNPNHPGAVHLYVHALEGSKQPQRAEAAADRLENLMPAAGHLVHMPSHIYWRVGRYADAEIVNVKAVAADREYFKTAQPSPTYRTGYYPHNIDFIWQAAAMQGRSAATFRAADEYSASMPPEMIAQMPDMEAAPAAPIVALVRFGQWDKVLRYPEPPASWIYTRGVWHYARGLAFNAKGQAGAARRELSALDSLVATVPETRTVKFFFRTRNMLQLAANVLGGEIAAKAHDGATAERLLAAAVAEQDSHSFTDPPPWYAPVRQTLGAVLLELGRPADAERVYHQDLLQYPDNGWSLYGLAQSLRAQGKTVEAVQVDQRFKRAWSRADVKLTASRF